MGHGGGHHHITPAGGNQLPTVPNADVHIDKKAAPKTDEQIPKNPKEDAAILFDKKWQNSQADARRNNLTTLISDVKKLLPTERNSDLQRNLQHDSNFQRGVERDSNLQSRLEQAKNLLNLSTDDLVSLAAKHKDLESFHGETKKFWDDVKKMSEIRIVETFVNGKPEPRAASRYGDLLALLNRHESGGGNLQKFLTSLPRDERNVFLARYQINRTFGANELFAGRGVALDGNGRFPLQIFLAANGKNAHVSVSAMLSLIGGDISSEAATTVLEKNGVFLNSPFLLDGKSAALNGFGLALYQNINALLSLNELAPEEFSPKTLPETFSPKTPGETTVASRLNSKNTFENAEIANLAARRAAGEALAAGALINGALLTIEKYRKAKISNADLWADVETDNAGFRFSAGATGAMMGATVGCVVPLAEKSLGEILGFAASVVVGLTDTGLRSLGANALVSVITSGVQSFLNVSSAVGEKTLADGGAATKLLNAADATTEFFENDLGQNFLNRRVDAFSTS